METLGGLLALAYMAGLVVSGFMGASLWTPVIGAVIGIAIYNLMRPSAWRHVAELWYEKRFGLMLQLFANWYVIYFLLSAAFYGLGRAIGYIF